MTDDTITPDRLRLAGLDDDGQGLFSRKDAPQFVRASPFDASRWYWFDATRAMLAVALTGMGDVAARLAKAQGGAA